MINKLLNDLKLNKYSNDFAKASFKHALVNKNNKDLKINIEINDYIIPEATYTLYYEVSQLNNSINVIIDYNWKTRLNNEQLLTYFNYFVSQLNFSKPFIETLKNREVKCDSNDDTITINVHNEFENNLLTKELVVLQDEFKKLQLNLVISCNLVPNQDLDAVLDQELSSLIKDVKTTKQPEVKSEIVNSELLYGRKLGKVNAAINNLEYGAKNLVIEGEVFSVEKFLTRTNKYIITYMITDYISSIHAKLFIDKNDAQIEDLLNLAGKHVKMAGSVIYDEYLRSDVFRINAIKLSDAKKINDDSTNKRVELHIHTNMSALDSVIDPNKLVEYSINNGYEAIGVVDHNSVQAFPTLYNLTRKTDLKVIYGVELNIVNDDIDLVFNDQQLKTYNKDDIFIVFDFETTGLNPFSGDKIIEIGAVKVQNGEVIDKFDKLCNPNMQLSQKVIDITGIKNSMLVNQPLEREVVQQFKEWIGDFPLVAHNARFDFNFLYQAFERFELGTVNNIVFDTLKISRALHPEWKRHNLATLTKKYKIVLDNHHRACDDATATATLFTNQLQEINEQGLTVLNNLNDLVSEEDRFKFGELYHMTALVKDNIGLKNLFKLVSLANTKYYHKEPRLLKSIVNKYRKGLLLGTSCSHGEVFKSALKYEVEELANLIKFYDYVEVQPPEVYHYLVDTDEVSSNNDLILAIKKIISAGTLANKLVVASGDVHHLLARDKIFREVIINTPVIGGGFHYLKKKSIKTIPSQHFRTTTEMFDNFSFLADDVAKTIIIDNPKQIVELIGDVEIIKDNLYVPKLNNSKNLTYEMVYNNAKQLYGEVLPELVNARIEKELNAVVGHGFDVIYLISSKLVEKSLADGYLVGSRGSVGSSFVATLMNITEINPLEPHYLCPNCTYSEFIGDVDCGYDLPTKVCPKCHHEMNGEGHNIPFETFLGFNGDKVPDIDLNFSGDYQATAHNYTKELFGESFVYRAGTITTIAEKTAFGYIKGYQEDHSINFNGAEMTRLAKGCQGVKRSTGQHPGGILIVPSDMDIYDFTPIQYPADDTSSNWYTTHFDFHAIHDNILKLDILGHDDPTILHMLTKISGIDSQLVNVSDPQVVSIFASANALQLEPLTVPLNNHKKRVYFTTGTLGVPEFGTRFVIDMLNDTKPKTFAELVKISGLSHGTDVWVNNGQDLIRNQVCEFKEVIGCRDDIMVYLMGKGLDQSIAFKIMEDVRKGKGLIAEYIKVMQSNDIPDWYIDSCNKIKYMFPKAHASAYVLMAMRIAYFKVFHPIYFYATYFSIRADDFDIMAMINGKEAVLEKITEILNKEYQQTVKEKNLLIVLELALEMLYRGFKFQNISLERSHATEFIVEGDTLIPPFTCIDGFGISAANSLISQRELSPFVSIEDLKNRTSVNNTILTKLEILNVTEHLPEGDQLTLF